MQNNVVSVIIPAFNEEKSIGYTIEEITQIMETIGLPYEIIVVDDGSTDRTREIASKYKAIVLSNGKNQGKGYALRKGFQHAEGNIIITIDADGSHRPKEIPDLLNPLFNGADIVTGSRFLNGDQNHTCKLHILGNKLINMTIMILTRKYVTDSQTGLRAFKKEFLNKVYLESDGYEIETEITVKGLKNGFTFKEIPITCDERKYGISKLRILSDAFRIFKTIILRSMAQNNNSQA